MLYTVLKKSCMFALLAGFATSYAVDDLVNDADRSEMQQESESVNQRFFESLSQALKGLKSSVQESATDVAAWTQSQVEAAGKQLEKTRKSAFVKNVKAKFQEGYTAAKNIFNTSKKELANVDLAQTKQNIKTHINQSLNSIQKGSKNAWNSVKNWFDGSSNSMLKTVSAEDLVIIGGATAIAAIVIGGVTYVLYKSGAIKVIGTEMKNHPVATFSAVTAVTLLSAAFVMYRNPEMFASASK